MKGFILKARCIKPLTIKRSDKNKKEYFYINDEVKVCINDDGFYIYSLDGTNWGYPFSIEDMIPYFEILGEL